MLFEIELDKKLITEHFATGSVRAYEITEGGLPEGCEFVGVRGDESGRNLIFSFFKNDGDREVKTLTPILTTRRDE